MCDGDIEWSKLCGKDFGEGGKSGADDSFGSVERRVDGGDDGGREDENLRRGPALADGVEARCEEWEERLDGEDRLEEVGVEKVGEAGWRDCGDRRGLVVEVGNEDDRLESEEVRLDVRSGLLGRLEVHGKALDGRAGTR
jgi:hypothetical protein